LRQPVAGTVSIRAAVSGPVSGLSLRGSVREVFRLEAFDQSRSRLQAAFESKGLIDASVRAEARPDPAASAVDLEFGVAEGIRASIAAIEISGGPTPSSGTGRRRRTGRRTSAAPSAA
jgi:outer membrane protein assembly factor BamA